MIHGGYGEMAAATLFHPVKNHPWVEGNRRVGSASAFVFLELNRSSVEVSNVPPLKTTLGVAEGKKSKRTLAEFFLDYSP